MNKKDSVSLQIVAPKIGKSDDESRAAIKECFEGMENLEKAAMEWAAHHLGPVGLALDMNELVVAYATALDMGYRIGKWKLQKDKQ